MNFLQTATVHFLGLQNYAQIRALGYSRLFRQPKEINCLEFVQCFQIAKQWLPTKHGHFDCNPKMCNWSCIDRLPKIELSKSVNRKIMYEVTLILLLGLFFS